MRIVYSLVLSLAIILNAIELSSPFDCLPNGDPIPWVPRSSPSYSPAETSLRARSRSPVDSSLQARPTSPPARRSSSRLLGHEPLDLKLIRLIPETNPNLRFEIRKYTFPRDIPIQLRGTHQTFVPMPTEERMVLSTSNGDIFAIFDRNNRNLRGMYTTRYRSGYQSGKRVKINMESGAIEEMTQKEIDVSPLGMHRPILKNFKTEIVDDFHPNH